MFRIDHPTRVAALPSPAVLGSPGFFTKGDPSMAVPATRVTQDWLNAVQEELAAAIEGQGLVLDKGNRTQLLQAMGRIAGGNVNLLLNPEGRFVQEGATRVVTTAEVVAGAGPDHWWAKAGGAGDSAQLSGVYGGAGISEALAGALSPVRTRMQFAKTVDATTGVLPTLRQSVEGVQSFNGKPVVLAFDAIKNGGLDLAVDGAEVVQDFGTGGSPSADVTTQLTSIGALVIDGSFRRFVFTGTLPSISGKTIGNAGNHHLKVRVRFAADQTFTVWLTGFVFSRGSVDPGYQPRDDETELQLLRRYKETSIDGYSFGNFTTDQESGLWDTSFAAAGLVRTLGRRFKVPKFGTPTVTWYAHDGTPNNVTEAAATLHPVTSTGPTSTHTGYPTITTPPAAGLRDLRAYFAAVAEIPD